MDIRTSRVRRTKAAGWQIADRPEHDDVSALSRPCWLRWVLTTATAREWAFAPEPLHWKPGSESGWFGQPKVAADGKSFRIFNRNEGGKRHFYTLRFRHRSTGAVEEFDPSVQNWPRPDSMRWRIDRELLVIGGAVALGGLLALLVRGRRGPYLAPGDPEAGER